MNIQEEFSGTSDPFDSLEDDYGQSVLHLAWDLDAQSKARTLLFGWVELLPVEVPPPLDDYDPLGGFRLGNSSKHRIYVRHAVTTARKALDWYLAARLGVAILPEDDGTIPLAESPNARRLTLGDLSEEPPWPTTVTVSRDVDAFPFVPQWIRCPRTHHLLPLAEFDQRKLWSEHEYEKALRWLRGSLHFDLAEYPEYWGSIHLVAANPVYRVLKARLEPRDPPAESVLLRFRPRARKSVAGLELAFREKDPWGVTLHRTIPVDRPLIGVNLDREVRAVLEDVWDRRRGLLEVAATAHPFAKSITTKFRVAYEARVRALGQSYDVMRSSGDEEAHTLGSATPLTAARSRLLTAHFAREKRRVATAHGQRWFRDDRDEARDLLRSLLNEASREVLLIDPYFGAVELATFALAVGRDDIPIRILSSAEVLKKWVAEESQVERGDQLADALKQLGGYERMNPFEVRVMSGDRPAVHDRFLAIDDTIWHLGSSLNEFGSRGTMLLALPDPDAVRGDLLKAWNEAETLGVWIERRRQSRKVTPAPASTPEAGR